MWTTVVVASALSVLPAEAGGLKLTNVRNTFGAFGPRRAAGDKILPGCAYAVAFDIEGVTVAPDGEVRYSTAIQVTGPEGKVIYEQKPRDLKAVAALGGDDAWREEQRRSREWMASRFDQQRLAQERQAIIDRGRGSP